MTSNATTHFPSVNEPRLLVVPSGTFDFPRSISTHQVRITISVNAISASDCEAVVEIAGEIELANIGTLRTALRQARSVGPRRIIVDASELDFLAVAAARELVAARDITIVGAYGISKRVLDLLANANPGRR